MDVAEERGQQRQLGLDIQSAIGIFGFGAVLLGRLPGYDTLVSEVSETTADQLTMGALADLAAPSLFSAIRCVVVRGLEDLPDETYDGVLEYAASPAEDVGLVLVHSGGQKGSGLLTKLRKLGPVTVSARTDRGGGMNAQIPIKFLLTNTGQESLEDVSTTISFDAWTAPSLSSMRAYAPVATHAAWKARAQATVEVTVADGASMGARADRGTRLSEDEDEKLTTLAKRPPRRPSSVGRTSTRPTRGVIVTPGGTARHFPRGKRRSPEHHVAHGNVRVLADDADGNLLVGRALGDQRDFVCVMVNIDMTAVGSWAERNNVTYASYQELANHPRIYDLLQKHVEEVNRSLVEEQAMAGAQMHWDALRGGWLPNTVAFWRSARGSSADRRRSRRSGSPATHPQPRAFRASPEPSPCGACPRCR